MRSGLGELLEDLCVAWRECGRFSCFPVCRMATDLFAGFEKNKESLLDKEKREKALYQTDLELVLNRTPDLGF